MGDRCWLQVKVAKKDVDGFWDVMGRDFQPDEEGHNFVSYFIEEANYGWYDELIRAADSGYVFSGDHGPGAEYSGRHFCGIDGKHYDCVTANDMLVVAVNDLGIPVASDVEAAREYAGAYNRVSDILFFGEGGGE